MYADTDHVSMFLYFMKTGCEFFYKRAVQGETCLVQIKNVRNAIVLDGAGTESCCYCSATDA